MGNELQYKNPRIAYNLPWCSINETLNKILITSEFNTSKISAFIEKLHTFDVEAEKLKILNEHNRYLSVREMENMNSMKNNRFAYAISRRNFEELMISAPANMRPGDPDVSRRCIYDPNKSRFNTNNFTTRSFAMADNGVLSKNETNGEIYSSDNSNKLPFDDVKQDNYTDSGYPSITTEMTKLVDDMGSELGYKNLKKSHNLPWCVVKTILDVLLGVGKDVRPMTDESFASLNNLAADLHHIDLHAAYVSRLTSKTILKMARLNDNNFHDVETEIQKFKKLSRQKSDVPLRCQDCRKKLEQLLYSSPANIRPGDDQVSLLCYFDPNKQSRDILKVTARSEELSAKYLISFDKHHNEILSSDKPEVYWHLVRNNKETLDWLRTRN